MPRKSKAKKKEDYSEGEEEDAFSEVDDEDEDEDNEFDEDDFDCTSTQEDDGMKSRKRNQGGEHKMRPSVNLGTGKAMSNGNSCEKKRRTDVPEEEIATVPETTTPLPAVPQDSSGADCEGSLRNDVEGGENGAEKKKKKNAIPRELKAKMRGEDPRSKILCAMYKQNKPGNASTVEGFTGHKIPKGIVQNTLEELSKSGELTCKEGKSGKIYWFTQTQFKKKGLDIAKLQKSVDGHTEELARLQEDHAASSKKLRHLEATPADDDLDHQLDELAARRDALKTRVDYLSSTTLDISPRERLKMNKQFTLLRAEWTKRKRWCNEALGTIADSFEKKATEMAKIIGIETDEDASAMLPPVLGSCSSSSSCGGRPLAHIGARGAGGRGVLGVKRPGGGKKLPSKLS